MIDYLTQELKKCYTSYNTTNTTNYCDDIKLLFELSSENYYAKHHNYNKYVGFHSYYSSNNVKIKEILDKYNLNDYSFNSVGLLVDKSGKEI